MDTFIDHPEICAATAKKLGTNAEQVDSTVTTYMDQLLSLMKEKRPTNHTDRTIARTPIFSAECTLEKEKIVTENGKKYSVSKQCKIRYGIAGIVFKALNEGLNITKTLIEDDKKESGDIKITKKAA